MEEAWVSLPSRHPEVGVGAVRAVESIGFRVNVYRPFMDSSRRDQDLRNWLPISKAKEVPF